MALQWSTSRQKTLPSAADGVTVTPSGSAWTSSAWVQLSASVSLASLLTGLSFRTASTAAAQWEIDIGTGGAGAEVVIGTLKGISQQVGSNLGDSSLHVRLPIPIDNIAAGVRLACRIRLSTTAVTVWVISVTILEKPIVGSLLTTVKPLKVLPSAANLTSVTTGGSAWVNSSYGQIIASTPAAIVVVAIVIFQLTSTIDFEVDIATGGAGSETVITTLRGRVSSQASNPWIVPLPNPLDNIAAAVRVAGRGRASGTSNDVRFGLIYFEKPL